MPYEKLVRDIKDILVSHAPEIFNTNMTTYNEAERVSKIAEKYANDYRDMAMRQDVLMRLLADFYNECQALDQEAQEKPQKHEDYSPLPKCSKCCWEVDLKWTGACAHCGSRKPQQPEKIEEYMVLVMRSMESGKGLNDRIQEGWRISHSDSTSDFIVYTLNRLTHKD